MAEQILLYGEIFEASSKVFLTEMEALKDEDIVLRIDTVGGDPEASFGMISKFQEHQGGKIAKVDGRAFSAGAQLLTYIDNVEALDVSSFLFHRAAFPKWLEDDPEFFTDTRRERLTAINKAYRKAMEAKIDVAKFEQITGVTMDELFSMDSRIDVRINARQAKQIGLINKINPITPKIQANINAYKSDFIRMAAKHIEDETLPLPAPPIIEAKPINTPTLKIKNMDINTLKAEYPSLYAQVKGEGINEGVIQERDRARAWLTFADIDLKAVSEGIKGGNDLGAADMADLTRKGISAKVLQGVEDEAPPVVDTPPTKTKEVPMAAKEVLEFEDEVQKELELNKL